MVTSLLTYLLHLGFAAFKICCFNTYFCIADHLTGAMLGATCTRMHKARFSTKRETWA